MRRLLDAVTKPPKSLLDASNLTVTGLAVMTWDLLYEELGHCPNRWQLRERVEQMRGAKISDRHWDDVTGKARSAGPLVPVTRPFRRHSSRRKLFRIVNTG